MPFTIPWTDLPSPRLEQEAMRFYWRTRSSVTPESWNRSAALTLGFDGLGAEFALTGAWRDNAASRGVTESLGYERTGHRRALRRGEPDEQIEYRMSRAHWATIRRDDITLHGIDTARRFLGLD
jgi:RimJ/RimL family protein N-acetyltransferase